MVLARVSQVATDRLAEASTFAWHRHESAPYKVSITIERPADDGLPR
jgi:hypothetical protein